MALSLERYTEPNYRRDLNKILKERTEKEKERATNIEIRIGGLLNEVLIIEILSWLPVKALLQFKTVCKSWCAIITSPSFISKHLENYYYNNDSWCCLLANYCEGQAPLKLLELLVDETPRILASACLDRIPMHMSQSHICGPCNGIYYLFNFFHNLFGDPDSNARFSWHPRALWNPAINELKVLPPLIMKPNLPSHLEYLAFDCYGFGFDPVTKVYKVVVMTGYTDIIDQQSRIRYPLSVFVYSLRTDSWIYWGDLAQPYDLETNNCYICVDGCLYWLGYLDWYDHSSPDVIISFDLKIDACKEIDVPNYEKPASKSLGTYDDSLALFAVHKIEKRLDIWILNKEGFWNKKFSMATHLPVRCPVGHWKNNKVILEIGHDELVLCDPDTQQVRELGFRGGSWCGGIFVYMESLVSIKGKDVLVQDDKSQNGH